MSNSELIPTRLVRRLRDAGFEAYWVGGCVRDFLLKRPPVDYDVATSARPEQIEALFSSTVPVGKQFGVILVIEEGIPFQIATFRSEWDYQDGRRPSRVVFSDAQADAGRRDFTINGLFYDPIERRLYDWVSGREDLEKKLIRTIGRPEERFAEDHLRLLRAVRFAAQLNFEIEAETAASIKANAAKIVSVSAERIREELLKLFQPPHAARGLSLLRESGLLAHILPEIEATVHCRQSPDFHPEGTVYQHLLKMLDLLPEGAPPSLPWAVLLHDVAKPLTFSEEPATGSIHFYGHESVGAELSEKILDRLRFPKKQNAEITLCVRNHMQFKDAPRMRKSTLRRLLLRPTFPLELELHKLDCLGSHGRLDHYQFLAAEAEALSHQPTIRPPLIKGDDLIKLGIAPGPEMGRLLAEIRSLQLEDELKTAEEALAWAKGRLHGEPP